MEEVRQYIQPELLTTIPILYVIGMQLKRSKKFPDSKIPVTLGIISIALSILYTFSTVPLHSVQNILQALFTGVTQGLLCAGTSVYTHQLMKQGRADTGGGSDAQAQPPPSAGSEPPPSPPVPR